jgi:hypothetical protein
VRVRAIGDDDVSGVDDIDVPTAAENAAAVAAAVPTAAQVNAEAADALSDYDPPTRAEATADKAAIIAAIEAGASAGDGDTPVDHDTGGADVLAYKTSGGSGIDGAEVRAYVRSEYDAGNLSTVRGMTVTDSNGRWVTPLLLNSGVEYAIRFEKDTDYGPDVAYVTVP